MDFPVFNTPAHPEFSAIMAKIHNMARTAQVNYSLHFCDGSDQWYAEVSSAAPSENHVTKDHMLSITLELLYEHLNTLVPEKTDGK